MAILAAHRFHRVNVALITTSLLLPSLTWAQANVILPLTDDRAAPVAAAMVPLTTGHPMPQSLATTVIEAVPTTSPALELSSTPLPSLSELAVSQSSVAAKQKSMSKEEIGHITAEVSEGLLRSFLRKADLKYDEKVCLQRSITEITVDVVDGGREAVVAMRRLMAKHPVEDPDALLTSAAINVLSVVTSSQNLIRNCVTDDALSAMNVAAHQLRNLTFVKHRFIVNGVDIAEALAHSVVAWEHKQYYKFGTDIGTALRKILLSKAAGATKVPEGFPESRVMEEATEGLLQGFFARGSTLTLTDAADPEIFIQVNLNKCISGNKRFFHDVWDAIWALVGKMSANNGESREEVEKTSSTSGEYGAQAGEMSANGQGYGSQGAQGGEYGARAGEMSANSQGYGEKGAQGLPPTPAWARSLGASQKSHDESFNHELAIALMQVPRALMNCNVNQRTQQMLFEAMSSLNSTHIAFDFSGSQSKHSDVGGLMAAAVSYWADYDFKHFGVQVGVLLREVVMAAFPQKYAIDSSGRLRLTPRRLSSPGMLAAFFGCAMCAVLATLVALRSAKRWHDTSAFVDIENGSDRDILVE